MAQTRKTHTMRRAMNAHGHPRASDLMKLVAAQIKERFYACVAMPNVKNFSITTTDRMIKYHSDLDNITGGDVQWLMKLYFTSDLTPAEVERAARLPYFAGLKYYPRGLTTSSDEGIEDPSELWTPGTNPYEVLRLMGQLQKPVSYHGADGFDKNGVELDPYAQERNFYCETFPKVIDAHPDANHIGEHISTSWGASFMETSGSDRIGCTVTGHHLHLDRRDVYRRGFHPDYFCWPAIQSAEHREALGEFVLKGHPFVMLGDDAAGHPREAKECGCCAGGVYTGAVSLELYTEHFARHDALDKLEAFASLNAARRYGIKPSEDLVTLINEPWHPPTTFACDDGTEVVSYRHPDRDGKGSPPIEWQLQAA